MTYYDLKERMERFIHQEKHVTSAKLARIFGGDPQGSIILEKNLVTAPGISSQVGESLLSLIDEKRVYWSPICSTAYYLEGLFIDLPVAYVKKPYQNLHWIPTAFNTPKTHERLVDAMRHMGVVGHYPMELDMEWVGRLHGLHKDFECRMCGKCCTIANPVSLEPQDVERISAFLGISIRKTIRRYATFIEEGDQRAWMMKKTMPCVFYDPKSRGCRIHPARPLVCRAFPFLSFHILDGHREGESLEWCPSLKEMLTKLQE